MTVPDWASPRWPAALHVGDNPALFGSTSIYTMGPPRRKLTGILYLAIEVRNDGL
jgi:hypothetical protein